MWEYLDPQGERRGPFDAATIQDWNRQGWFDDGLLVAPAAAYSAADFVPLSEILEFGPAAIVRKVQPKAPSLSNNAKPKVSDAVTTIRTFCTRIADSFARFYRLVSATIVCDERIKTGVAPLWNFISEQREQSDPVAFGKRLPMRRLYLLIASICVGIYLFNIYATDHSMSPEQKAQKFMQTFDSNLTWPQNGTSFNNLLDSWGESTDTSDDIGLAGWVLLVVAVIIEPFCKPGIGLHLSQVTSAVAMVVLFVGLTTPATPNYVAKLEFAAIMPFCAKEFNSFIDHLVRNLVGLACSGYFAAVLFVMLLSISPALVRVSKIILLDGRLATWKTFQSPMHMLVCVDSDFSSDHPSLRSALHRLA